MRSATSGGAPPPDGQLDWEAVSEFVSFTFDGGNDRGDGTPCDRRRLFKPDFDFENDVTVDADDVDLGAAAPREVSCEFIAVKGSWTDLRARSRSLRKENR